MISSTAAPLNPAGTCSLKRPQRLRECSLKSPCPDGPTPVALGSHNPCDGGFYYYIGSHNELSVINPATSRRVTRDLPAILPRSYHLMRGSCSCTPTTPVHASSEHDPVHRGIGLPPVQFFRPREQRLRNNATPPSSSLCLAVALGGSTSTKPSSLSVERTASRRRGTRPSWRRDE